MFKVAMATPAKPMLLVGTFLCLAFISSTQNCSNYNFPNKQVFKSCVDLPALEAHLHWNYIASTQSVQLAYRANQASTGWIAWAINPTSSRMVGSQALVAFQSSNGSMTAFTTPIDSYSPSMKPGDLSFKVSNMSATYADNEMTILAVVSPVKSTVNHVWQAGNSVSSDVPQMHATSGDNVQSMGTINFLS